jgi:hypothetical protein
MPYVIILWRIPNIVQLKIVYLPQLQGGPMTCSLSRFNRLIRSLVVVILSFLVVLSSTFLAFKVVLVSVVALILSL